jgi:molecular chaperone HscB
VSDPFETLGLEPRFELDLGVLESRHRELSRALHPDRYAGRGAAERREALSRAIEVNDAARALKDPIRRAMALLERRGVELSERDEGARATPAFLMDVLELREELHAAQRASDLGTVERLEQDFLVRQASLLSELGSLFDALAKEPKWAREQVEPVAKKLGELRFVRRLLGEAQTIQDELG